MSKYCEDCGTRMSSGFCPNCEEEAVIYYEQHEYLPPKLSEDFQNKVAQQFDKRFGREEA